MGKLSLVLDAVSCVVLQLGALATLVQCSKSARCLPTLHHARTSLEELRVILSLLSVRFKVLKNSITPILSHILAASHRSIILIDEFPVGPRALFWLILEVVVSAKTVLFSVLELTLISCRVFKCVNAIAVHFRVQPLALVRLAIIKNLFLRL